MPLTSASGAPNGEALRGWPTSSRSRQHEAQGYHHGARVDAASDCDACAVGEQQPLQAVATPPWFARGPAPIAGATGDRNADSVVPPRPARAIAGFPPTGVDGGFPVSSGVEVLGVGPRRTGRYHHRIQRPSSGSVDQIHHDHPGQPPSPMLRKNCHPHDPPGSVDQRHQGPGRSDLSVDLSDKYRPPSAT